MSDDTAADMRGEIRSVLTDVVEKGPEEVGASWTACAEAGLLGLAAPTEHGGEGLGIAEVGVLVHEVGVRALDLPFRETLACGLLTLVRSGTPDQQEIFIPRIVSGRPARGAGAQRGRGGASRAAVHPARNDLLTGRKLAVPVFEDLPDAPRC